MKHIRSIITLGCLAAMAATSGAQGFRSGSGITDIMRAGPRLGPPPVQRAPAAPSAAPVQRAAEFIVALVNSEPITNTDVQSRVTRLLKENPDAERVPRGELARLVLERLIVERAQLQLAKEGGIKVDDVAIDQAEQTVARQNEISLVELRRRVAAEGIALADFRSDLRDQLLLTRLRDREVESKVKISDTEADEYLRDQRNSTTKNAAFQNLNLAQVLVALPENATDAQVAAAQKKAQGIAERARSGEDFAKLVRENSDSPDRENGGAIGMRSSDRYPPLFVDAVQSTGLNGIAGPVRSSAGFHVLKVLAKAQIGSLDATVTQTQVRHILLLNDPKRTTAQAVAQLAEFKRRVQAGTADFAGLARDNSQDASAKEGGDLGWSRPGQFVPEFEEAMDRLSPGQISDPVVSRFGVHLIQVVGRRDSKLTQTEQREAARNVLREQRVEEAFTTWVQEVRARAYVEYRDPPQS
ncbi:peptidylprolyl isomerase [Variovorax sp. 770b2]|jgi:peptidyl-prolyl cis-trans isomerase SurA|uniref:peptidylprolyl isomerase n=1 Tax=Variovorax sp. 770b2 TaxID=1566271 RepID=UPI0008F01569|nr:peptidylprolyl isomerase [Variovorax sp. 770b2]SFP78530.1 periplasmic chaperone for outer membrane proteins SurA [Variovorax sp. 770b2]